MDFARKQLEKYGWSEGKGLGKNENGIGTAIKPKLKFDQAGIGHDAGEQFTNNWWEKLFNNAAQNIDVEIDHNAEIKMKLKSNEPVEITTKSYSVNQLKKDNDLTYGSFLKTSKLTQDGVENYDCAIKPVAELSGTFKTLTDDELFVACGGRTAHKGARHGLKLSGKLSRIEKQEKLLLKKMKKVTLSDNDEREKTLNEKKLKKLKEQKEANRETYTAIMEDSSESISSNSLKKKKKRKSVSFNETVTRIYTVDLDTSFESEVGSNKEESNNEQILENIASGSDEGIELDIENNNDLVDHHSSFEVARVSFDDISKAERKKLKKKRKYEAKHGTQTAIFLQKLKDDGTDEPLVGLMDQEINKKKRKYLEDYEYDEHKRFYSITESPDRHKNKKNKKKRKKQMKMEEKQMKKEEKQMNSIVQSLDSVCRISERE